MPASNLQHALKLLQQNAVDDAIAVLTETVRAVPAHAAAHVLLARAYETRKEWEKALRAWKQAHFLVPTSSTAMEGIQRVLRQLDPTTTKRRASTEASSDEPASPASRESDDENTAPPSSVSAAAEALSELQRLRREEETETPREDVPREPAEPSTVDDASGAADTGDRSGLEQLRRQADAEAQRGGARGGMASGSPAGDPSTSPESASSEPRSSSSGERGSRRSGSSLDEDFGDLDRLIEELESARITPTPNPSDAPEPEMMDADEDADDDSDDLVSETLARIYASQGKYREAMRAYLKLAAQKPDRTRALLEEAAAMRAKAERAEAGDA